VAVDTGGTHLGLVVHLVEVLVTALELVVLLLLVRLAHLLKEIMVVMVLHMLVYQVQQPAVAVVVSDLSEETLLVAQVVQVVQAHRIASQAQQFYTLVVEVVVEHLLEELGVLALEGMVVKVNKVALLA
jgi:hypothetical protein